MRMCILMKGGLSVQVNIDENSNKCQFEQCINYEDGYCLNDKDRKNCIEIATAVLCINTEKKDD